MTRDAPPAVIVAPHRHPDPPAVTLDPPTVMNDPPAVILDPAVILGLGPEGSLAAPGRDQVPGRNAETTGNGEHQPHPTTGSPT